MSHTRGGLDEVGWGSLAGPIISVVAVFDRASIALLPPGVKDSKKTTEKQRGMLYLPLCKTAVDVGVGHAWPWEIDRHGPYPSLQLSYTRAIEDLKVKPDVLLVDGKNKVRTWRGEQIVRPKADSIYLEVSAASIIAKYFRDQILISYEQSRNAKGLPSYGFHRHKGYGTAEHEESIRRYGLIVDESDSTTDHSGYLHRLNYCKKLLKTLEA